MLSRAIIKQQQRHYSVISRIPISQILWNSSSSSRTSVAAAAVSFSSLATAPDDDDDEEEVLSQQNNRPKVTKTTPKRTRVRKKLDPIVVTQSAADRLQELLDDAEGNPIGIRLGTKKRGCNGLSYTLNYVTEEDRNPKDEAMMGPNKIEVFIQPMALMNIIGTTMDWEETELSAEFTFTNPNSKGECGCGESFNVK